MSLKTYRDLTPASRSQVDRAKTAAQSKNYDYAITLMQATLRDEPLYLEGRRYLRAVEIQKYKAMGTFTRQMVNMKSAGNAMKFSGKKTPQEQLVAAEEILATDPYNFKANVQVGEAGAALGCPAFKCFSYEVLAESKADVKPGDKSVVPILHSLAQAYMEDKDAAKAEKTYEKILTVDPRDGEALSGMKNASAANASKAGNWDTATDYRDVLKDQKQAEQLEQQSKVVKSADAIQDQIDFNWEKFNADPQNPVYSKAIASLCEQRNDFASAVQWYTIAYEAGERNDSSLEKMIGDLKVRANEAELRQLHETLAAETDPALQAQYQEAIETKEKEFDGIRLELAEARVRAQPNEGEFRFDLGAALFKVGQYKRATEELQQSLKQPSVRHQALNLMGQAYMKRNMLDFATKQLVQAESELISMDDLKKQVVYNLGLAYESSSKPQLALEQWKKIYEYDMSYRDVARRVEDSYGGSEAA